MNRAVALASPKEYVDDGYGAQLQQGFLTTETGFDGHFAE
jgi:hypothetical protein